MDRSWVGPDNREPRTACGSSLPASRWRDGRGDNVKMRTWRTKKGAAVCQDYVYNACRYNA